MALLTTTEQGLWKNPLVNSAVEVCKHSLALGDHEHITWLLEHQREMITGRGPGHSLEEGMLAAPTLNPAHSCTTETRPGVWIFSPWLSWVVRPLTKAQRSMVSHQGGGPLPDTL